MTNAPHRQPLFKGARNPEGAVQTNFLTAAEDADFDIRRACNTLKRMTSVAAACVLTGANPTTLATQVEEIAIEILKKLGFNMDDHKQMGALLGMVCEPVATVVAEAALAGASELELMTKATLVVTSMTELARSKSAAKLITERYPNDIAIATALRMSAASSVTAVAIEIAGFDFCVGEARCIKEASKHIVNAAFGAADFLAEGEASQGARSMLTQSLMQSAGKLYSACYRSISNKLRDDLESMPDAEQAAAVDLMSKKTVAEALAPVAQKFHEMFDACINEYAEVPALPVRAPRPSGPRPR